MDKKLVIFDLDGVLVDSRDMHYKTLNMALVKYGYPTIPYSVHLAEYNGLPTSVKLAKLGIPFEDREIIWKSKQRFTEENIDYYPNKELHELFRSLQAKGIHIAVASNAVKSTILKILDNLSLLIFVEHIASAEEFEPKPSPVMYWECMKHFGVSAKNTLIIEDSHIGRKGAHASGATVMEVEGPYDFNLDSILRGFDLTEQKLKWKQKNLNILIPMAGEGSRFAAMGYTFPKPLIDVKGKPMIQLVVENLNIDANYIFIVQQEHYRKYHLQYLLNLIAPHCKIIQVNGKTEGAACTALLAKELINNNNPLLIVNSDQIVGWNSNEVMYAFNDKDINGGIVTFESTHPKWSYVKRGETGLIEQVVEKKVISNEATVGIYFWKQGSDFVTSAEDMIRDNERVNGEFYIAPTFNRLISIGGRVRGYKVNSMQGLGTPEDLQEYLRKSE